MNRTRAYLTARLDQLDAANADDDDAAATDVLAGLIQDDNPDARQVIADALRLRAARDPRTDPAGPDTP